MENLVKKNEEKVKTVKTEMVQITKIKPKKQKNKKNTSIVILTFIITLLVTSINWLYFTTGNLSIEQLIFHLKVPIQGTNTGIIWDYIKDVIPLSFIITALEIGIFLIIIKFIKKDTRKKLFKLVIVSVYMCTGLFYIVFQADVIGFAKNQLFASLFIEENYIDANNVVIEFPEEKQNLIYIYLESMESSYTSIENGGIYNGDYIKELRELAQENTSFSNTKKLGGAVQLPGTNWTIAGMVAQTAGVPLKISIEKNSYGQCDTFLPGSKTLGEILQENGYKNYFLLGSDVYFGGRKNYFEQHGNYEIWDVNSAIKDNKMTEDEIVWWGFDDKDLIEYSKQKLLEISKNEEPFNFTMLTVDTHFVDGYVCDKCENKFGNQYANVISCSSKQISEFVSWIQEQDFYENTTIIISGDHLTMQATIEEDAKNISENYERTVFNAIINENIENVEYDLTRDRNFATIDMFPTTLAALGAKIEGEKLGLGTNLYSGEQTLIEKFGQEYVLEEIEKKSVFYNNKLIYNR